jgi:hypothetical protein
MLTTDFSRVTQFLVISAFDFRLPPRCWWDQRSSGVLRSIVCQLFTDVSGQCIGLISKGQESAFDAIDSISHPVKTLPQDKLRKILICRPNTGWEWLNTKSFPDLRLRWLRWRELLIIGIVTVPTCLNSRKKWQKFASFWIFVIPKKINEKRKTL